MHRLPASITGFAAPEWQGRVGWAPTNGSSQAFSTVMRQQLGEDATRTWRDDMIANETKAYEKNAAIVQAIADVDLAVGALINIAGVGILKTAANAGGAQDSVLGAATLEAPCFVRKRGGCEPQTEGPGGIDWP